MVADRLVETALSELFTHLPQKSLPFVIRVVSKMFGKIHKPVLNIKYTKIIGTFTIT